MRLIDADALQREYMQFHDGKRSVLVDVAPTIEPERKKGNWVGVDDEPCDVYECDRCGTTYDTVDSTWDLPNFCPCCGADMRGEKE